MKKRIVSLLLSLVFVFTLLPMSVFAAEGDTIEYNGLTYTVLSEDGDTGTGTVSLTRGNDASDDISIPATVTNDSVTYTVTTIGGRAFDERTELTSITIPDTVTTIGDNAFHRCTGLTAISIPSSVKNIGNSAFNGCTNLASVSISNGVEEIRSGAFYGCTALTSITIPDSVDFIGSAAFQGCTRLTSVTIPSGVTTISSSAFESCTGLTSVTISDGVKEIGMWTFANCTSLTSITIPDSVTRIYNDAFTGCTALTAIYYDGTAEKWAEIDIGESAIPNGITIHPKDGNITSTVVLSNELILGGEGYGWSLDEGNNLILGSGITFRWTAGEECGYRVENNGTIIDGIFVGNVHSWGTITGGTFSSQVDNSGTITGGTFSSQVYNHGTITGGTFSSQVDNDGTIEGGNFSGYVDNFDNATISGGVFTGSLAGSGSVTGKPDLSELTSLHIRFGLQFGKDAKLPKAKIGGMLIYTGCDPSTPVTLIYYADGVETAEWTVSGDEYSFPVEGWKRTAPDADFSTLVEIAHEVKAASVDGYEITVRKGTNTLFHVTVQHTHTYGTEWESDGTNHWHECSCGARAEEAAHSGGTATCTEKAKCSACGTEYGNLAEHTYDADWTYDATSHWHAASCGHEVISGTAEHSYGSDRTCDICGYTKPAPYIPPSAPIWQPDVDCGENGEVTISPRYPEEGDKVTITTEPDAGYEVDKVIVTDRKGNELKLTGNGDGTYTFKQPYGKVTVTVTFRKEVCDGGWNCPVGSFTDLDADAWYHDGIHYCVEHGLMQGSSNNRFDPNGTTSRAMIWTILARLDGVDTDGEVWYAAGQKWAMENGISDGTMANDPITREQLATILWRYAKYKGYDVSVGESTNILSYEDAFDISGYAIPAMQWACGSGIINGIAFGGTMYLEPQDGATRAQAATMLMQFCEMEK